ncbi:STAS domain-containing protein [Paenibacillus sp. FSL R5-0490]|uniref:STAS domain-containing protein n=1 Tax=Bacillales TaxID=1385 RepID=UPI0009F8DA47|nr:STAS domain-containing protein [Paenibacillus sp. FSL R5-0490]
MASRLLEWRENLVGIYAQSIASDIETTYQVLKEWGDEAVDTLVNYNLPIDIALKEVRDYRNLIGHIIRDDASQLELTIEQFYEIISDFDSVVDRAVHWLSISYSKKFYTRINLAEAAALELSIPVIKITSKIGILPLIGDIDTQRAQELMEKALTKSNEFSLEHIIIDLSGVPVVDTMVADRIIRVVESLTLLGVKATLTGIRPEIAQTLTHLGINISHIDVATSLQKALQSLLKIKL